jgi:hypothetical protein
MEPYKILNLMAESLTRILPTLYVCECKSKEKNAVYTK